MRRLIAASLAIVIASAAAADDRPIFLTPEAIGEIFCIARLGNDMAPVEGILTPGLAAAIAGAEAENAAWATANPGEKPPLGDGIPWQSWPDYAPECTVASASLEMDESRVRLLYSFPDTPEADFSDTLSLRLVPGPNGDNIWRVDNVGYGTDGDLRRALVTAFMDN